jgi:hypothetical protein
VHSKVLGQSRFLVSVKCGRVRKERRMEERQGRRERRWEERT